MERLEKPGSAAPEGAKRPEYLFCGFRLEPDGALHRGETRIDLEPAERALLLFLLAHPGQTVTPTQLRKALPGDIPLSPAAVSRAMTSLKTRLAPEDCIQSVYKRGYRFSAEVRVSAAEPDAIPARLAIVPLAAEHGVPDYLGSAVAEETNALLQQGSQQASQEARHAGIFVLAQESVNTLARRGLNAQQIAAAMGADLVLTGNLRALANRYRLRAEMISGSDGSQLWVEEILVERGHTAAPAAELANCISSRTKGGGVSISAAVDEPARSPEQDQAHELFQRAHYGWQSFERHRMQDAVQRLLRAIELDPALTAARVDLANLSIAQSLHGFMSSAIAASLVRNAGLVRNLAQPPAVLPESAASAPPEAGRETTARETIDALLPALGWVDFHFYRNMPAALAAFSHSAHLFNVYFDPWVTRMRALFALSRQRFDEAIVLLRDALRLDPYSAWLHARLGWALHLAGDREASIQQIEHALREFPERDGASLFGALILAYNGSAERAVELARDLALRRPYFDLAAGVLAYALACAGRPGEARGLLERLEWMGRERFVLNSFSAAAYLKLGDHDAALELLKAADNTRCPWFFQVLADPRLAPLHGHAEFARMQSILEEMEQSATPESRVPALQRKL